ncbi:hypothetical protein [Rubripirellula reticaptiva]|uniref:hypothetical protein n=1 Tax=Rubripirellula reticaptiva TaxID=2528013 RepID=UPI0011B59F18|nr:hypothetical protein [Rubripirellula reticaptiva]
MLKLALLIACVLALFPIVPTITLSIVLLFPLPTIGIALLLERFREHRRILGVIALPALIGFYYGLLGPLSILFDLPEEWGFIRTRHVLFDFCTKAYPQAAFDILGEHGRISLANYRDDWGSLVRMIDK